LLSGQNQQAGIGRQHLANRILELSPGLEPDPYLLSRLHGLETLLRYRAGNTREFNSLLDSLERIRRLRPERGLNLATPSESGIAIYNTTYIVCRARCDVPDPLFCETNWSMSFGYSDIILGEPIILYEIACSSSRLRFAQANQITLRNDRDSGRTCVTCALATNSRTARFRHTAKLR
jgi:hypothetical protein